MPRMSTVAPRSLPTSSFADRAAQAADRLAAVPRLREGALLVASLLLALSAAQWTWALLGPVPSGSLNARTLSAPQPAASFSVATIQQAGLFGMAPLAAGNLNSIPVSSLNLVLTGLVDAGSHSYALIQANGHPEAPFGVGEDVLPGVRVAAVYGDRVILRHGGRDESLFLKQDSAGANGALGAPGAPLPVQLAPNQYQISATLLKQEMTSPQKLMTQALMVPYAGGGFLVRSLEPGSLYQKLGLQPGDVVQAINGQPLRSVQQAMKIYGQLPNANAIDLQILRNGQAQQLHYVIQ